MSDHFCRDVFLPEKIEYYGSLTHTTFCESQNNNTHEKCDPLPFGRIENIYIEYKVSKTLRQSYHLELPVFCNKKMIIGEFLKVYDDRKEYSVDLWLKNNMFN